MSINAHFWGVVGLTEERWCISDECQHAWAWEVGLRHFNLKQTVLLPLSLKYLIFYLNDLVT